MQVPIGLEITKDVNQLLARMSVGRVELINTRCILGWDNVEVCCMVTPHAVRIDQLIIGHECITFDRFTNHTNDVAPHETLVAATMVHLNRNICLIGQTYYYLEKDPVNHPIHRSDPDNGFLAFIGDAMLRFIPFLKRTSK